MCLKYFEKCFSAILAGYDLHFKTNLINKFGHHIFLLLYLRHKWSVQNHCFLKHLSNLLFSNCNLLSIMYSSWIIFNQMKVYLRQLSQILQFHFNLSKTYYKKHLVCGSLQVSFYHLYNLMLLLALDLLVDWNWNTILFLLNHLNRCSFFSIIKNT